MELAREITALYHGHESAALAEEHFRMVFRDAKCRKHYGIRDFRGMMDSDGVDAVKLWYR